MDKSKNSKQKTPNALIKDLAPEEKSKIGELVKRLAEQTTAKQQYKKKYEDLLEKYEELVIKFDTEVIKKQEQNRMLKMQMKDSYKTLEKTKQAIQKRRSAEKISFEEVSPHKAKQKQNQSSNSNVVKPKEHQLKSSSKKQEILQLRSEIEQLTKNIKNIDQQKTKCFDQKIKKYQEIKTRYNNQSTIEQVQESQTLLLDTTFKQDKTFDNTLIEPKVLIKDSYKTERLNQESCLDNTSDFQRRYQSQSTVKKLEVKPKSYFHQFYDEGLFDLVEELGK